MRDAAAEQRIAARGCFVHVRVERVAGQRREALDVRQRDFALRRS